MKTQNNPPCSMPVMKVMCSTCPFREGSEFQYLMDDIKQSALVNGRICHSTHTDSVAYGDNPPIKTGPEICRGARDFQLMIWTAKGLLKEPTDAEWQRACDDMGIVRDQVPENMVPPSEKDKPQKPAKKPSREGRRGWNDNLWKIRNARRKGASK